MRLFFLLQNFVKYRVLVFFSFQVYAVSDFWVVFMEGR